MGKSKIKEPVKLREKKLANGNLSLYLDYYQNGERQYEFLKLYISAKPKNALEKQSNKEVLELAQRIKAKRIEEVFSGTFDLQLKTLSNTNFLKFYQAYIDSYTKKDLRTLIGSFKKFKEFLKEKHGKDRITAKEVSQNLIIGYKDYLEANQTGEGPLTYFNRFRKVIKHGNRENIFPKNPLPPNLKFKSGGVSKGVLSMDEIKLLAKTYCGNEIVKRAFLFGCNTGLRYGDIKALKWTNITQNNILIIKQSKTEETNYLSLNSSAKKLIGERGDSKNLIFPMPSFNGSSKTIKNWVKRAGIDKRITWHSSRHSFATNILLLGYDVKTLSTLLGHTSIKHTQKYLSIADERKAEAVNALPEIEF
jgi:integrase/recombinase XerD